MLSLGSVVTACQQRAEIDTYLGPNRMAFKGVRVITGRSGGRYHNLVYVFVTSSSTRNIPARPIYDEKVPLQPRDQRDRVLCANPGM